MIDRYPASFADMAGWARANAIPIAEARKRFAQYAILRAITSSRTLSALLVFKGGNALDFVWQPNRSPADLDFSADMVQLPADWDVDSLRDSLRATLATALSATGRALGVSLTVQKIVKQPPTGQRFVTYAASTAYALEDEGKNRERIARGEPIASTIPLEISLNEPICADTAVDMQGTFQLRVSTIEDIVAEKLRALLQQITRNRTRRQDLLDIAVILKSEHHQLDPARVSEYCCVNPARAMSWRRARHSATRSLPHEPARTMPPSKSPHAPSSSPSMKHSTCSPHSLQR